MSDGRRALPAKNGKIRRVDMSLQLPDELRKLRVRQARDALAKN